MFNRKLAEAYTSWAQPIANGESIGALDLNAAPLKLREMAEVLRVHFPTAQDQFVKFYVVYLAQVVCDPSTFVSRWDQDAQRRLVEQIETKISTAFTDIDELPTSVFSALFSTDEVTRLQQLSKHLKERKAGALREANRGNPTGRTNWSAVALALACSNIWFDATGAIPPKTVDAQAPGPFGRFLQDTIDLFEVSSSARSALRAMPDHQPVKLISVGNEGPLSD